MLKCKPIPYRELEYLIYHTLTHSLSLFAWETNGEDVGRLGMRERFKTLLNF